MKIINLFDVKNITNYFPDLENSANHYPENLTKISFVLNSQLKLKDALIEYDGKFDFALYFISNESRNLQPIYSIGCSGAIGYMQSALGHEITYQIYLTNTEFPFIKKYLDLQLFA